MNKVYSVSQINYYIKNIFVKDNVLNSICIKGEVSNCKYHTSGHIYFTLKDESGQLSCVMFAGQRPGLNFRLEEGISVLVLGNISVYERDGKYQLYANEIRMNGLGILFEKFEQLKKKLDAEGLFNSEHKKKIPEYITKLGVVTARTGAAVQDIINITKRRNPYIQIILYPSKVQGTGAAEEIVNGIKTLEKYGVDVIIVGRGGGSIEDLWAFNEEKVARAICNSNVPIISAIGHETDTTIADYVADLRAPTPSAAAELAVFEYTRFMSELIDYHSDMLAAMNRIIASMREKNEKYLLRIKVSSPDYRLKQRKQELIDIQSLYNIDIRRIINDKRHEMAIYTEKLLGLSPLKKLNLGYSYVTNENGRNVRSIDDVKEEDIISVRVSDGDFKAVVMTKECRIFEKTEETYGK